MTQDPRSQSIIPDVVVVHDGPGRVVAELVGEHDLSTREEIRELLVALVEENELVVVDLSSAAFIDSSVMQVLAQAHRAAQAQGSRLRIQLDGNGIVYKALEVTGLLDSLDCVRDRAQALCLSADGAGV